MIIKRLQNIRDKYDFPILISLIILPFISIVFLPVYIYFNGIIWQEPILLVLGLFLAGTGITVGYHRLFAHRSFKTSRIIEWFYMITGSMALQNTILNWCSDHRRHHKKLDTKEDPYSINEGFFHAHIGWIVKKNSNRISGVADLEKKSAVMFQNKYYWFIAFFLSFVLPFLIGLIFGRPLGGLLWGGVVRVTLVHHFTFFINSFCHYLGSRNFDVNTSARDSGLMAILTFGEGYHNFHHKFQWDYRNGIRWYNFDPSKWIIKLLSFFSLAYNLRKVPDYLIIQARIDTIIEKINKFSSSIQSKNIYKKKIIRIISRAKMNLDLWKKLEKKYQLIKNRNNSNHIKFYKTEKEYYKIELQKSISSLLLILVNIKSFN